MPCGVVKKKKKKRDHTDWFLSFFLLYLGVCWYILCSVHSIQIKAGATSLLVLASEEDTLLSPTAPWGVPVFSEVALGLLSLTCHTDSSTHTLGVQRTSQRVPIWKSRQWFALLPIPKLSGDLPPGLAWRQRATACQRHWRHPISLLLQTRENLLVGDFPSGKNLWWE